jgi:hypothetical protein
MSTKAERKFWELLATLKGKFSIKTCYPSGRAIYCIRQKRTLSCPLNAVGKLMGVEIPNPEKFDDLAMGLTCNFTARIVEAADGGYGAKKAVRKRLEKVLGLDEFEGGK